MGHFVRTAEQEIARIATASHGVVTRAELLSAGVTVDQITRRLRSGALLREHRGVYRVGHRAPSIAARYLAAVRACGDRAVLSGLAAAYWLGLLRGGKPPPPEVTTEADRRVPGVRVRRARRLTPGDVVTWRAIPVTAVPRTLVDLAGRLTAEALARACHEAGVRYGTTPRQVEAVLAHRPNVRGAARLRAVMSGDVPVVLSRLEKRFLAHLRAAGLALPQTNRPAGGRRVDCRWPR